MSYSKLQIVHGMNVVVVDLVGDTLVLVLLEVPEPDSAAATVEVGSRPHVLASELGGIRRGMNAGCLD